MKNSLLKSRKFRQGSLATAVTVVVVALIVVINMVVSILADRYNWSIDMTENKLFSISDETKEHLQTVQKDVEIIVLNTEEAFSGLNSYYMQANEIIRNYGRLSSHIDVRYVDIVANPAFVERYAHLQPTSNLILVVSGENAVTVAPAELFSYQQNYMDGSYTMSSQAEQALTSAILEVTSEKRVHAVLLTGHDEEGLSGFVGLLEKNNYLITEQNLLTEEVDESADIAILAAPKRDLTEEEMRKLDRFLDNGGEKGKILFYLASVEQPELPNLNAFLIDWGVSVGSGVTFEYNSNRLLIPGNTFISLLDYGEEEYAENTRSKNLYTATGNARPLQVEFESRSYRELTVLLHFSELSGVMSLDDEDFEVTQESIVGNVPALTITSERTSSMNSELSYVLVSGSTLSLDSMFLDTASIGNSEYYLGLLNNLAGKEDGVIIQDKTLGSAALGITAGSFYILFIVLTIVFPLAVLIFGIVVWMRRRHR